MQRWICVLLAWPLIFNLALSLSPHTLSVLEESLELNFVQAVSILYSNELISVVGLYDISF